jgi:hypothetical protein
MMNEIGLDFYVWLAAKETRLNKCPLCFANLFLSMQALDQGEAGPPLQIDLDPIIFSSPLLVELKLPEPPKDYDPHYLFYCQNQHLVRVLTPLDLQRYLGEYFSETCVQLGLLPLGRNGILLR